MCKQGLNAHCLNPSPKVSVTTVARMMYPMLQSKEAKCSTLLHIDRQYFETTAPGHRSVPCAFSAREWRRIGADNSSEGSPRGKLRKCQSWSV